MIETPALVAEAPAAEREELFRKRRRLFTIGPQGIESAALFAVFAVAYGALGYRLVVQQHVVVFDALARLAHAYFVWFNQPPKLAAVGFVWPPLSTIVFLPLAAVKPLALSLAALPFTSALFAAGLLVILNRIFAIAGMPRLQRFALVLAFAVNPMIAFYASNGMSEIVYLFFLVAAVYFFLRWYLERTTGTLVFAAVCFSGGVLSRYEVFAWALVLTVAITIALIRQHASRLELEGTLIAYLAPISYAAGLWLFFNWLILGDPLFWLRNQAPGGAANTANAPDLTATLPRDAVPPGEVLTRLLELNWQLFPLTLIVLVALAVRFAVKRDLMALTLGTLLALNAAFTGLIVWLSDAEGYFQLRYNMRAMPLALTGVAWLYLVTRHRRARLALWAGTLAVLLLTLPQTWRTMQTYPFQYLEQAFTRAVASGDDQEGTTSLGGYGVGIAEQRAAAEFIDRTVSGRDEILTDDAQTFSVILLTGKPGLFFDRIDRGDAEWVAVLGDPFGRVGYVLVSSSPNDAVRARYPRLLLGEEPGFTTVYDGGGFTLLRVSARRPDSG